MKRITVLGSTGSIGTQTLEVALKHGFEVVALSANRNIELLKQQVEIFHPECVCIADEKLYKPLCESLHGMDVRVLCGMDGLCEIAGMRNIYRCVNALVGMVGVLPTLTAIRAGTDIALANKETLVAGGKLIMSEVKKNNVKLYPIDSEHSAIFQCMQGNKREQVKKIILTASGGPFFGKTKAELANVTVQQALKHPNWSMGRKITIDSATLMNKGLEFIEAKWLFDVTPDMIEIVVHRESVVHSAVEYNDCSVIAQMGVPDMKIPIQYALLYPERFECPTRPLSLTDYGKLTFYPPDFDTFDCMSACIKAISKGGAYPCIANSVNEEAVALFLEGRIPFLRIGELVKQSLEEFSYTELDDYNAVSEADKAARDFVHTYINKR